MLPTSSIKIDLNLLWPTFRTQLMRVMDDLYDDGYDFRVTSGYRGEVEQNGLYAQGRTKPGKVVTNAKYGFSFHNFGIGVDVTHFTGKTPDWKESSYAVLGKYVKHHGLRWGGDFKSIKDLPHIEYPLDTLGLTLADLRKVYAKDGLPGVWKLLDTALKG